MKVKPANFQIEPWGVKSAATDCWFWFWTPIQASHILLEQGPTMGPPKPNLPVRMVVAGTAAATAAKTNGMQERANQRDTRAISDETDERKGE